MGIPPKEAALKEIEDKYGLHFSLVKGKQILYSGKLRDGRTIMVCTPETKVYQNGNGWVDITKIQRSLLASADMSILAVRMEDTIVYYYYDQIRGLFTESSMHSNEREGDHWKLHIWPDKIEAVGGNKITIHGAL